MQVELAPTVRNPFSSATAREHSAYSASVDGKLVRLLDGRLPSSEAEFAHIMLRAAILHPDFPCVGAKSAVRRGTLRTAHYAAFAEPKTTQGLARDLFAFVAEGGAAQDDFASFIATFPAASDASEEIFERDLWHQLQLLRDLDARYHAWDPAVDDDPRSARFAYSFARTAFFVVGMHPGSGRWARRLAFRALAFNPRRQFDRLRADGNFTRMQQVIRAADRRLQGSLNPMLGDENVHSEARQYSGRAVEATWRCPFEQRR